MAPAHSCCAIQIIEGRLHTAIEPWYSKAMVCSLKNGSLNLVKKKINIAEWSIPEGYEIKLQTQMGIHHPHVINCLDLAKDAETLDV